MKKNNWYFLINPFTKIAGWKAFGIGIVIVIATVLVGYLNGICFPGLISIKSVPDLTLGNAFLLQSVGLLSTVIIMYIAGLIFAKNVRFQDILGTTTLSRAPLLLLSPFGFMVEHIDPRAMLQSAMDGTFSLMDIKGMLVFGLLCMLFAVWVIALLYNAFRVSTNIKGGKSVGIFIAVILLSEVLANIALYLIL